MRLDQLRVELRPRSPWEAVELGTALVRRNAAAIWAPWLLLSLPVFVVANVFGWWLQMIPLAAVLMWWLKPVFDRIPLFVVSRAVFGNTPTTRQTLAAQHHWAWRPMFHYLSWRRLGPARALYLPIDLLEGAGAGLGERRRVLGGAVRGIAVMLTLVCVHFELALVIGALAMVLLFIPLEFLPESARAAWSLITEQPPPWAQVALNALIWMATSVIEPFYVGAGFGLYLNRRTQIEAWDVEIAFRRLRQRLAATASVLVLGLGLAWLPVGPSWAQASSATRQTEHAVQSKPTGKDAGRTLQQIFDEQHVAADRFGKAVDVAYTDSLLSPRKKQAFWIPRNKQKPETAPDKFWLSVGAFFATVAEYGLWILLVIIVIVLIWTSPRWRPWLRDSLAAPNQEPSGIDVMPLAAGDALPDEVAKAARSLWREGRHRRALALLYRASVDSMVTRTGVFLVPGATEAECLRAARALPEIADRDVFARVVRVWQYAAYAERLPADDEFDTLVDTLSHRFGWVA